MDLVEKLFRVVMGWDGEVVGGHGDELYIVISTICTPYSVSLPWGQLSGLFLTNKSAHDSPRQEAKCVSHGYH